ncbi:TonB-dependent receptor (plasmid) [Gemmatirosa kalamazoonensis]|uniref:TonB-dependent receptor n=1 Tax=Gemmatirosa kalamazoonensis TaxID=861299 RepID=W0RRX9_9BACT|nr:TonB-dependent receptor [Gemmatirosa kalamazoonensis]AHG93466.1 TonB-dependent receptor [Gemmatirosa kalamazoonensis]
MPQPRLLAAALLASSLALRPGTAAAQTPAPSGGTPPAGPPPSFEIRGRIVDTANTPIPQASVTLRLKANGLTVAGALAGRDGAFRITGLRPGRFSIRVAYIGYAPVIQDVTLPPTTPVLDLGVAKLAPVAVTLSGVTVKEERAAVVTEPDRNAYRAKDLAPGAANASELLEHVPSVQVDMDGKVSLRGNENVVVQINGRPTPMRGAQLAAYLKTLSANVIDRIEVIPNPSAKYDPEGMAGIINVALKSNVDLGLSGAVNTAVSDADRYNGSGNLGYQSGPWSTFVGVGLVSDHRTAVGVNDRERFDATNALQSITGQDILLRPRQRGQNLNATVDYKLSPRDVLSNALILSHRGSGEASTTTQTLLSGAGATLDQYVRPREADATGTMFDYDVALKRTLAPRVHEISTELRFNRSHDEDANDERRLSGTSYRDGKIERNDAVTQQLTAQVDYLKAFAKRRTKLEAGWKSNVRWIDRDYAVTVDPTGTGTWAPSPLSNVLAFDEGVHAVYAVLSQGVKKWDLQAGLRGEYANRTFSLATQRYPYDYASLFPSAVASYTLAPNTTLKSSYSRRIRRPGTQELNPFPNYFDADNVFFGNPDLRPEYTDAMELGLTKTGSKGMLQISPFYRRTTNIIRIDINTTDTLDTREVTSISFRNLAHSDSWGSDLTGQLRLSPRFTALTNFGLFKQVTDGGSTSAVGSNAIGWMGRINVTSEVTRTLTIQAAYNYRAPLKIERGEYGAQQVANVALRRKIQGDRGAVLLRVADPFEMVRFRIKTSDGKVLQLTERNPQSRVVFLGYQYNFGRPPRVRQVTPEQTGGGSVGFGTPGS